MSPRSVPLAVLAAFGLLIGCKKDSGSAPHAEAAAPADAKTVEAFKKEFPSFDGAGKGKHVKIHGYAQTTGALITITDGADKTVPFAFCKATTRPANLKAKVHVVAEGTLDERGDLDACTLSVL